MATDDGAASHVAKRRGIRLSVGWAVLALITLFGSFLHQGYYLEGAKVGGNPDGRGVVLSCSADRVYLGLVSNCRVRTPGRNAPVVERDDRIAETVITLRKSQLNGAGVGDSVELSYSEGVRHSNPNDDPNDPLDDFVEGASRWHAARPIPSYGWEVPAQVALWIFGAWCAYRSVRAFRKRFDAPPPPPAPVEGTDKFLVIAMSVLTVLFAGGSYLIHSVFISGGGYGTVGTVLAWIGASVLGLAGLACLLGVGTTWSAARNGKSVGEGAQADPEPQPLSVNDSEGGKQN